MELLISNLPRGMRIASGGTRDSIKKDRPWQPPFPVDDPKTCVFIHRAQKELEQIGGEDGWRIIKNSNTPFPFHHLAIPKRCLPPEEVYNLGGVKRLAEVIQIASQTAAREKLEIWLGIHIGYEAAQNQPHFHCHMLSPIGGTDGLIASETIKLQDGNENLLILADEELRVLAGGVRAGQCFILGASDPWHERIGLEFFQRLSSVICRVVELYRVKFMSKQGLPPEYMVGVRFTGAGVFMEGYYLPILNHMGFTEYFGMMTGAPLILPWPHEVTAEYLRS